MNNVTILLFFACYLFGCIPSALIVCKVVKGIDIREHGSKNMGATNVFRVLGKGWAMFVLLLDGLKGFFAVFIARFIEIEYAQNDDYLLPIICGSFAVLGHVYPVFSKFKGGKGVATALGVSFGLNIPMTLLVILVFSIFFAITKTVSKSVLVTGLFYPLLLTSFFSTDAASLYVYSIGIYLSIIYTHRKNIVRIVNKKEQKLI